MIEVNEKLSHLTNDELDDLITRYQSGDEKVSDLIEEFCIDIRASNLLSILPPIVHEDLFCPYCEDTNLVSKRQRGGATLNQSQAYCLSCNHQNTNHCFCSGCREKEENIRRETQLRKRAIIEEEYTREITTPAANDISLSDALFLLSITRHSLSEDMEVIEPFDDSELPLAPLYDFQNEVVKHLYSKGFITISPESPIEAFVFDASETDIDGYYPVRVTWEFLPEFNDAEEKRQYLKDVQSLVKSDEWPAHWEKDISKIWHKIAKYECLEYFLYLLEQRDFNLEKIGEKTHATFDNLLEDFPVSKIFNLSWMAVRDTTDYIVRENIPRFQSKNIFIGAIQRKADRARAEGWEIRNSRRDYNCPQTVISSTFFNLFLGIGDKAFETIPPNH